MVQGFFFHNNKILFFKNISAPLIRKKVLLTMRPALTNRRAVCFKVLYAVAALFFLCLKLHFVILSSITGVITVNPTVVNFTSITLMRHSCYN